VAVARRGLAAVVGHEAGHHDAPDSLPLQDLVQACANKGGISALGQVEGARLQRQARIEVDILAALHESDLARSAKVVEHAAGITAVLPVRMTDIDQLVPSRDRGADQTVHVRDRRLVPLDKKRGPWRRIDLLHIDQQQCCAHLHLL
jgi:hypothetical protein